MPKLLNRLRRDYALTLPALAHRPTRANLITVASPQGGSGKTTCVAVLADALAAGWRLRTIAIDLDEYGDLRSVAPARLRAPLGLHELMEVTETLRAEELRPYLCALPSGAHFLGPAPQPPTPDSPYDTWEALTDAVDDLLVPLARFYDVIVLDTSSGAALSNPITSLVIELADQVILPISPRSSYAQAIDARNRITDLGAEHVTLLLNHGAPRTARGEEHPVSAYYDPERMGSLPHSRELADALYDSQYRLEQLPRTTQKAIVQLCLVIGRELR